MQFSVHDNVDAALSRDIDTAPVSGRRASRDYVLPCCLEPIFTHVAEALSGRVDSYYEGNDRRDYAKAIVARLSQVPETVAIASYPLSHSRADVAIFTPTFCVALLFMTEGDEYRRAVSRAKKSAVGTEGFDYTVLFDLTRAAGVYGITVRNAELYAPDVPKYREACNPEVGAHVACFTWPDHDTRRFTPLDDRLPDAWSVARTPAQLVTTLIRTQRPKRSLGLEATRAFIYRRARERVTPRSEIVLTGGVIAGALVAYLAARSNAPAAVVREARLGTGSHDTIADCLHVTPDQFDLYEIKGETDHPTRPEKQIQAYDEVGSTCTLVTTERHAKRYLDRIPGHWGLIVARRAGRQKVEFDVAREATANPNQTGLALTYMMRGPMLKSTLDALVGRSTREPVYVMRERISKALPTCAIATLAARDCAFRYATDGLRSSSVQEVGERSRWPAIRHIVCEAIGPLPALEVTRRRGLRGGPETRWVGPLFAEFGEPDPAHVMEVVPSAPG